VGGAYSSSPARITWREAMQDAGHRCHNGNTGYLASIQSKEENDYLLSLLQSDSNFKDHTDAWIGGCDMKSEGTFEWISGNMLTDGVIFWTGGSPNQGGKGVEGQYNNFENGEPNESGEEDCLVMRGGKKNNPSSSSSDGQWNDVACYSPNSFFFVEFDG